MALLYRYKIIIDFFSNVVKTVLFFYTSGQSPSFDLKHRCFLYEIVFKCLFLRKKDRILCNDTQTVHLICIRCVSLGDAA